MRVMGLRWDLVVVEVYRRRRRRRRMAWVEVAGAEMVSRSNTEIDGSVRVDASTLIACEFGIIGL